MGWNTSRLLKTYSQRHIFCAGKEAISLGFVIQKLKLKLGKKKRGKKQPYARLSGNCNLSWAENDLTFIEMQYLHAKALSKQQEGVQRADGTQIFSLWKSTAVNKAWNTFCLKRENWLSKDVKST